MTILTTGIDGTMTDREQFKLALRDYGMQCNACTDAAKMDAARDRVFELYDGAMLASKPAIEYFIDGKSCTPDEYIAWQAGVIEAVTKAKLPDPMYYGGSAEEGDQHDVKCAYVDGWNNCRASILAAPNSADTRAGIGLTDEVLIEIAEEIMKGMRAIATWSPRRDFAVRVMRERLAAQPKPEPSMADGRIKELVNRFLAWPLPTSVCADVCATNSAYQYPRSGTSLLNAIEAEEMLRHVLAAQPQISEPLTCDFCGAQTDDPWHTSGITEKHLHQCDACRSSRPKLGEPIVSDELHPETAKLIRRFARALGNKLLAAQRKYGYSNEWAEADWMDRCREDLIRHVRKGDPRDVAAYCAFLWHHDQSTTPAANLPDLKLSDELLNERIKAAEQATGIYWFVPDDSERYLWRTINTDQQRKFARALLAAQPPGGQL